MSPSAAAAKPKPSSLLAPAGRSESAGRRDRGRCVRRRHRDPSHRHRRIGSGPGFARRLARARSASKLQVGFLVQHRPAGVRGRGLGRSTRRRPSSSSFRRASRPPRRQPTWRGNRLASREGVSDPYGRVIAVTASPDAALEAGIDESRILQFSEGVGGRYSLWSAVSISAALALGWDAFEELLEGAAIMDRHFRYSAHKENVPLLAAFRRPALLAEARLRVPRHLPL
jgi:hypothetical protein